MSARIEGVAAAIMRPNINTDIVAPAVRPGERDPFGGVGQPGARAFGPWRYLPDGSENPEFVLNREPWRHAAFLIAGDNFACGSSRETAASWLREFGIRCVIAPSFGGIFHDNCFRNGILPLVLGVGTVERLAGEAERGGMFALDLAERKLIAPGGETVGFALPAFRRAMLVEGRDEVALTLARTAELDAAQERLRRDMPWIWAEPAATLP